jgi:hypothetical protein
MGWNVDQPLPSPARRPSPASVAVAAGLLVLVALGALLVSAPARRTTDPDPIAPPSGSRPIATGTLDGTSWRQFAWSAPGERICLSFSAGASSTQCRRSDLDASPFVVFEGDTPVTDGSRGATTTVIQGMVGPTVTAVRVVGSAGVGDLATLTSCACSPDGRPVPVFLLPVTASETAVDAIGRYVMVAAFDGPVELARVRVSVVNLGYCGREDCS